MSVKYKLVLKKDLTKGAATDAKRYYASANVTGMMDFDTICDVVADSAICMTLRRILQWNSCIVFSTIFGTFLILYQFSSQPILRLPKSLCVKVFQPRLFTQILNPL